jgi:hypothetical protein
MSEEAEKDFKEWFAGEYGGTPAFPVDADLRTAYYAGRATSRPEASASEVLEKVRSVLAKKDEEMAAQGDELSIEVALWEIDRLASELEAGSDPITDAIASAQLREKE